METVAKILQRNKLKLTPLREAVLNELIATGKGLSKQDLRNSLKLPYDRSTLFRTLNIFEEKDLLHKVIDEEGTARYAFSPPDLPKFLKSHAHFYCLRCKSTFCLDYSIALAQIQVPEGFQKQGVEMQVRGICKKCLSQNKRN